MHQFVGNVTYDKKIEWKVGNTRDSEEGLKIIFHMPQKLMHTRSNLEITQLEETLDNNDIRWLCLIEGKWILYLDEFKKTLTNLLSNADEKASKDISDIISIKWLNGKSIVAPSFDTMRCRDIKQVRGVITFLLLPGKNTSNIFEDKRRMMGIEKELAFSLYSLHPKIVEKCEKLFIDKHYAEAIFTAMRTVEEEVRAKTTKNPEDLGYKLISKVMNPDKTSNPTEPSLKFSDIADEQKSAFFLYAGAIGFFKNPMSHRTINYNDSQKAIECIFFASLLMRMLDEI